MVLYLSYKDAIAFHVGIVVFSLSFNLHYTHLVDFLSRDDVCAVAIGVLEYARSDFGDYMPFAYEVVLGETLARYAEDGCTLGRQGWNFKCIGIICYYSLLRLAIALFRVFLQ